MENNEVNMTPFAKITSLKKNQMFRLIFARETLLTVHEAVADFADIQ